MTKAVRKGGRIEAMRTRESGMPDEATWASFFHPESALDRLGLIQTGGHIVEFGCGYGTFTLPAARRTTGQVYAFDIDDAMVATTRQRAQQSGIGNVVVSLRDFVAHGTGLPAASADYAMLFNLLHAERPDILLAEAWRVLAPFRVLGIMHWEYDASTPRGPSMSIRPQPEQCRDWALQTGFELLDPGIIRLPPYHYGLALRKPE
jgi:ubiquinone/menaquinone biosynthesis C-methylase UbiE